MPHRIIEDPKEIERASFEEITRIIGDRQLAPGTEAVMKRVIHTTADFDYLDNLVFSEGAIEAALKAIASGATIVTDTKMAWSGINKDRLAKHNGSAICFIADEDVAARAASDSTTRAAASMEKAAGLSGPLIFAIGNAPTALLRVSELVKSGKLSPVLVIGVPVGFVNVVESKEVALGLSCPTIIAKGRKGGSNVAAAIVNALVYQLG
jgi:precorrin-8X/cobalt-precorrin-8 methylmutase